MRCGKVYAKSRYRKKEQPCCLGKRFVIGVTSTYCGSASSKISTDDESPRHRVSRPLPVRARKFDYERLYALLESYCHVRAQHAEVFHQLTPSSIEHV